MNSKKIEEIIKERFEFPELYFYDFKYLCNCISEIPTSEEVLRESLEKFMVKYKNPSKVALLTLLYLPYGNFHLDVPGMFTKFQKFLFKTILYLFVGFVYSEIFMLLFVPDHRLDFNGIFMFIIWIGESALISLYLTKKYNGFMLLLELKETMKKRK